MIQCSKLDLEKMSRYTSCKTNFCSEFDTVVKKDYLCNNIIKVMIFLNGHTFYYICIPSPTKHNIGQTEPTIGHTDPNVGHTDLM